ncbi:MAG: NADH-quinone oxidoreductase subunit L [Chloroflexota bacterium]|nr:NADH-quinone oxidoreductase subunit L [Chloroflexota bacterium]
MMELAWLIPSLPAIAFAFMVTLGKRLPNWSAIAATGSIAVSFALFFFVFADWLGAKSFPHPENYTFVYSIDWLRAGDAILTWGMWIDPISLTMLGLVTAAALGIQVYSWSYMAHEPRFTWFFAVHSLFAASMLALVMADNLLLLYIAWELVGICSYLLIGFFYDRRSAAEAAKKAFITTRVGDVGLLIGILLLFVETGTFELSTIFAALAAGDLSEGIVTGAAVLMLLGAIGKSAQFPFHVWLPDAMEGPTPVSALVHSATMVVAGVYLVARIFPFFEASDTASLVLLSLGAVTAMGAAAMALVMTDIKRVLAYSTLTDLAFMMLALGAGSVTAGMFHLLLHGFAKATLFLGAGSVSHGSDKTDIRDMGGLRRVMPWTALAFGIGALSLGGLPPFGGFFSKDEVTLAVFLIEEPYRWIFLTVALTVGFMKALYMGRLFFSVFLGRLKPENEHAHEAGPAMLAPMLVFTTLGAVGGLLAFNWTDGYQGFGYFVFAGDHQEAFHPNWWIAAASAALAVAGFGITWLAYVTGSLRTDSIIAKVRPVHTLVANKFYVDEVYQWGIDQVMLRAGNAVAWVDRAFVNDIGVYGPGFVTEMSGTKLRLLQSGKIYNYALGMVLGFLAVAVAWWWAL